MSGSDFKEQRGGEFTLRREFVCGLCRRAYKTKRAIHAYPWRPCWRCTEANGIHLPGRWKQSELEQFKEQAAK